MLIASRPARVMTRLMDRLPSSARQTGMPGLDLISRISLRPMRLDPILAAAALLIFGGTIAAPSSLAAAFDSTISWVSVNLVIFSSFAYDSMGCHQRARKGTTASGVGEERASALPRATPSNALLREEVQRLPIGHCLRCAKVHIRAHRKPRRQMATAQGCAG